MSLFWRVFLLNAAVLSGATALLVLSPATVSTPVLPAEGLILVAGLAAMLVANALLLRIGFLPLRRLTRAMTTIDLLRPGSRPPVAGHGGIADLIKAFNAMLDRLEIERATSNARALSAQEAERRRIARELHDEVGQSLTAVLLEMRRVSDEAPEAVATALHQVQETTRDSLDEIRRIARRLRPGVLEELGLASALKSLTAEVRGGAARCRIDGELPELGEEVELVIYRVAQESITNAVRHAQAARIDLSVRVERSAVRLRIRDDGVGIGDAAEGAGIRGMRERALLAGAVLAVEPAPEGGTEVRLDVPIQNGSGR
ncbi:HAMP domain-containing sensor histidine kinase [Saccharopolyspora flava]|uniref:histidine kinase n=1 Tax=Saccharopolyspora flava TaxID=95161 RepID=A0A1I6S6W4_9PSEU|nr:HAMP domain-containing sensor histidine kinase [Saccharopolyspora flava]SFS72666.1 two-component system, NarL family, sensor histidine kinase UhpB [Saccharopolyspora flava]